MKKIIFLIAVLCIITTQAFAYRILHGRNVTINEPVYENLYIAGGNIVINAAIHGDLVVAGGTIIINDSVTNDILLAGGEITFNGFVTGDIRCAGGNLRILKNISGDIVITGGTIIIEKGVDVGELITTGGNVTIDGRILNNVKAVTGKFLLTGEIMKDFDCRGGEITIAGIVNGKSVLAASNRIHISENAQFRNDVRYWAHHKVDFKRSMKNGKAVYDLALRIKPTQWYYLGFTAFWGLLWYLGMAFLMILIIQYLFSNTFRKAGDTVYRSTLKSLLFGILFCIAIPIAAVIALITLIGLPVGIILLLSYIFLVLLATVITSVVAANWLNNLGNTQLGFWKLSFSALVIFILLKFLTFTPFIGWLIMAILALIAFGSILLNIHVHWKKPATQALVE